jgi:hypothetical protein
MVPVSFRFVSISFRTLQVPIDNARFYYFVRIDIQGRVCLNVTIRFVLFPFRFALYRYPLLTVGLVKNEILELIVFN